jgi:hypothetical protein
MNQVITLDALKDRIGIPWPPFVYLVEKGMVKRFAAAIGDNNPLWQKKQALIPPTLLPTLGFEQVISTMLEMKGIVLHGSTELECYLPARVGDTITVTVTITSIRERRSEAGNLAFITLEKAYHNQHNELVARCRQLAILRQ